MTVALTTRGRICPKHSHGLSLMSWGVLCVRVRIFTIDDVGFLPGFVGDPCGQDIIYEKRHPGIFVPNGAVFANPTVALTGSPSLRLGSTRPSLMSGKPPGLYNHKAAQLTGTKVIRTIGTKDLLLSEPEEPTLTSSGTRVPDIFDKC